MKELAPDGYVHLGSLKEPDSGLTVEVEHRRTHREAVPG